MGAVGGIRRIKNAIGVARKVLENTEHSMLVGSLASSFAKQLGFFVEPLQTNYSKNLWTDWKNNNCQPNFWKVRIFFMQYTPEKSFLCNVHLKVFHFLGCET